MKSSSVLSPLLSLLFFWAAPDSFARSDFVRGPEAWLEFMGGNVARDGLRKDLEAISRAGISGVHFFHIDKGGAWPDCPQQIRCMDGKWDDVVSFMGDECRRLGLKLVVQNCPGWSQSGGPWISVSNAMRDVVCARGVCLGGVEAALPPIPPKSRDADSDWRDIAVLAFPTPLDDSEEELVPSRVVTNGCDRTYFFDRPVTIRTAVWKNGINGFNSRYAHHAPWMHVKLEAIGEGGDAATAFDSDLPMSNWRDYVYTFSLACEELTAREWRLTFTHKYPLRRYSEPVFISAARHTDWEGKSSRVLRSRLFGPDPRQDERCWVKNREILDLSDRVRADGTLDWTPPEGKWTVLRIGHVNAKRVNAPAPREATGWECDKLAPEGIEANFNGYVKRLASGPLAGKLDGIVVDSWECFGQTWTPRMEGYFREANGYEVRRMLPALFGWVIDSPGATERFLTDWRRTIGNLITKNYYGRLAELAHAHGLSVAYETAFGDVVTGDLLEYWKYADEPMCEFWLPHTTEAEGFVGSRAFKPIRPCVSAAHIYGKRRVTAEAFTGWGISWKEDFRELRDVANRHFACGVTHLAFQSYTHSPNPDALPPGACMGGWNGTPFTWLQTWWRHMPAFTGWLARCEERLEEGVSAADVLWYLGDAVDHKPDEYFDFPEGFAVDYLNHDALTNRLSVKNGSFTIPEGAEWKVLWVPEQRFMLPATKRRLDELAAAGGKVVYGGKRQLAEALSAYGRDVTTDPSLGDEPSEDFMWIHRRIGKADRYFIAAGTNGFSGKVSFRAQGRASIYDPVTERRRAWENGSPLDLAPSQSVFVEFGSDGMETEPLGRGAATRELEITGWKLSFEKGWGAPESVTLDRPVSWTEIPGFSAEAKAYSGTVAYEAAFDLEADDTRKRAVLDFSRVESIAKVFVNGHEIDTLWCEPYSCELTDHLKAGRNVLRIEVTNVWRNRVVYDLNRPKNERKTWTVYNPGYGPKLDSPLLPSGIIGPVRLRVFDPAKSLRDAFAAAAAGKNRTVVVPKGVYHFADGKPLELKNATNVVIRGEGATLVFHGKNPRMALSGCRNVTVRGFRILESGADCGDRPGLTLSGDDLTVEANVFERLSGPAIVLSGGCRKVAVRGNRVVDCRNRGGAGVFSVEPGARQVFFCENDLEQFKTTLLAVRGAQEVEWRNNNVRWNGNKLALWGRMFEVDGSREVEIFYDGKRIEEGRPPFGRLDPPAVSAVREYIWPEGGMPDVQEHQVAAKYPETSSKTFRREENLRPYVDWYLPAGTNRSGLCLLTVSGGGFECCCDGERLAPAIDRMVRSGTVVADLTYRTPRPKGLPPHHSAVQDLRQALKVVRARADQYGFSPERIGALGNSAGAKAVAVAAADLAADLRFAVLLAPAFVMSDGECGENSFGGDGPGVRMVSELSFGPKTCAMCLFQGGDDAYSPFSSIAIYRALGLNGVKADLHLFGDRWHGFQGNLNCRETATGWDRWYDRVEEFLVRERLLSPATCVFDRAVQQKSRGHIRTFERRLWPKAAGDLVWRIPADCASDLVQIVIAGAGTETLVEELGRLGMATVTLRAENAKWSDVQRAVRLVRAEAPLLGLSSERIGILGAREHGQLALFAAVSSKRRTYNPVDAFDRYPCSLAWAAVIDPAEHYDAVYDVDACPVLFLEENAGSATDPVSLPAWIRLRRMGVPCDLHVTPSPVTGETVLVQLKEFLNNRYPNRNRAWRERF